MKKYSIWEDEIEKTGKKLNKDLNVDVLIIGGGITGLSTAYHLNKSNLKVCVVERNNIGMGVTCKTTGKLTYLQELIYRKIKPIEKSKLYYESQKEAIKIVKEIIKDNNIECDYENVSSYVYSDLDKEINKIDEEYKILKDFGVNIKRVNKLPNGISFKHGIYVEDTAVFHSIKYLNGLKKVINCDIYENTNILSIEKNENGYLCKTDKYKIITKKIVLATHYPYFLLPYFFPLKAYLEKSYITAFEIDKVFNFSSITSSNPTESIRYHNNKYQIYLTNSHNLSIKNNDYDNFKELIDKNPSYIWSNKDIMTVDSLPYIGYIDDNLLIGTGYNTWGMTNGSIAGKILSDLVLNKENKYSELFNPKRNFGLSKYVSYPIIIGSNIKSYIGSKINKNKSWYQNVLFKKIDGESVGIYIDENNKKHIVYNKCPHLKCGLIFNEVEKTWDCPCHGSRFDIDGNCIEGPSNYDIRYKH